MGGISADDPQAVQKLEKKLESLEKSQETMKAVNAYYRKHKTLDGCPHLPPEELEKLKADMASSWHFEDKPFCDLGVIQQQCRNPARERPYQILFHSKKKSVLWVGNLTAARWKQTPKRTDCKIFFEDKPDEATREALKVMASVGRPKQGHGSGSLPVTPIMRLIMSRRLYPLPGKSLPSYNGRISGRKR